MKTTWGDIFWIWVFKGADHGYVAHMADKWEKRQGRASAGHQAQDSKRKDEESQSLTR